MPKLIKIRLLTASLLLICGTQVMGSNWDTPLGSRSAGMGGVSISLVDFWSVQNNPAGLGYFDRMAAGFYYENKFLVKELGLKTGAFILPTGLGSFGVNFRYFGYSKYNEMTAGLAFGRKFGKKFSAGLRLDWLSTTLAEEYGSKNAVTFDLGIRALPIENLAIGVHVFNPVRAKLENEYDERYPTVFRLGAAYTFSEKLVLAIETEKDLDFKPLFRTGIEYKIVEQASVRIGYSTLPSTTGSDNLNIASLYTFGFGLKLGNLNLDISSSVHQVLGWSPQVAFVYIFK